MLFVSEDNLHDKSGDSGSSSPFPPAQAGAEVLFSCNKNS